MKSPILLLCILTLPSCAHRDGSQLHATAPGTQQRSGDILLDLRTDKPSYKKGEPIHITLTTSQRSKVEIHSQDAKGNRTTIWPRPGSAPALLSPGQKLRLPPSNAGWKLTASEPLGTNTLVAKATSTPPPIQAPSPEFFQIHNGGWKGMTVEPKSNPVTTTATNLLNGEASWLYEVRK